MTGDGEAGSATVCSEHVERSEFRLEVESSPTCADIKAAARSRPYTPASVVKLVSEKKDKELKDDLRRGHWPLDHPVRARLWQTLCSRLDAWSETDKQEYRETVVQMEGDFGPACESRYQSPGFVHSFYTNRYFLEPTGVAAAERVLSVIHYNNPTIMYSPALYPICCLLLHYMSESDAYGCLNAMLKNKRPVFIVQTRWEFEMSWLTLVALSQKHTRTAVGFLEGFVTGQENMSAVLADWLAWIFCFLPFRYVTRIMDCFFVEGEKVLYRAALALVTMLHKSAVRDTVHWSSLLTNQSVQHGFETFCRDFPYSSAKLLKSMFHVKGFSRDALRSYYASLRTKIRDHGGRLDFPERSMVKSVGQQHSVAVPSLTSQQELAAGSSTIGIKERSAEYQHLKDSPSKLISFEHLLLLWNSLPQRYALYSPQLLYTSDEHGFSLKTFYSRMEQYEPSVLLLRTTEGAVLGAYCTASWATRNQLQHDGSRFTYFGTGEMFVFTLKPQFRVYPWVVTLRQAADPQLSGASHAEQLFMAADNTMLAIGGGGGGHAIWLDEDLARGKSDSCLTFDNPPLVDGGVFQVSCMEAFGFAPP